MRDVEVSYPSDDGPDDDGPTPVLHILRDDQGDHWISVGGRKPGWTSVRVCGPNGGGAATKQPDFYDAVSMTTAALAGDREAFVRIARSIVAAADREEPR